MSDSKKGTTSIKPEPEIDIRAAAALLGLDVQYVNDAARAGIIPCVYRCGQPPGGLVYFRARELGKWLEKSGIPVTINGEKGLLMSPRQVSQETGLPLGTLEALRSRGLGPRHGKLGNERQSRIYYSRADVMDWLEERFNLEVGEKRELAGSLMLPDELGEYDLHRENREANLKGEDGPLDRRAAAHRERTAKR